MNKLNNKDLFKACRKTDNVSQKASIRLAAE